MTKDIEPIYETLRNEIITLSLKPGSRIREEAISERFGVSRTPVRDVLKRLEEDKLVLIQSKSGTFVTKIDLNGLTDIMEIRTAVECKVMISLMYKITKEEVTKLNELLSEQEKMLKTENFGDEEFANLFFRFDMEFHQAIYALAGKESLLKLLNDSFPYYQRYRYMTNLRDKESVSALYQVHRDLLSVLEKHDARGLEEISHYHNFSGLNGLRSVQQKHPDYFI